MFSIYCSVLLNQKVSNYIVAVQSGSAKGYYEEKMHSITSKMQNPFQALTPIKFYQAQAI